MKRAAVLMCPLLLLCCPIEAAAADPPADPVLLQVESRLRDALAKVSPAPSFEHPGPHVLLVKYKARKFMIHGGTMTGRFSEKAHETDGPSYTGFILTVRMQQAGTTNQAIVPQTLRAPYWRTDLNVTKLPGTDKQLFWGLSYGSRPERDHLKTIKETIYALGKKD